MSLIINIINPKRYPTLSSCFRVMMLKSTVRELSNNWYKIRYVYVWKVWRPRATAPGHAITLGLPVLKMLRRKHYDCACAWHTSSPAGKQRGKTILLIVSHKYFPELCRPRPVYIFKAVFHISSTILYLYFVFLYRHYYYLPVALRSSILVIY